jgi:hypothetical protein
MNIALPEKFSFVTTESVVCNELPTATNLLFKTSTDFSYYIERSANDQKKTCTQVILDYCDSRDMEPSDIAKLISASLRGKIQMEMIEVGLLPEHSTLNW